MSYIKNISAGENIIIENLGDDSIRIHNNFSTQNLKLSLPTYFDWAYEPSKINQGDYRYYFHISNCLFQINGHWYEEQDIHYTPSNGVTYDLYLRVRENPDSMEEIPEKRLFIEFIIKMRKDNKIVLPDNPYDYHLFRFLLLNGKMEVIRMCPAVVSINCIEGGFVAYRNYKQIYVRNKSGLNTPAYQGIPTYSRDHGAVLIETPIVKNGKSYSAKPLTYSGENHISLGE